LFLRRFFRRKCHNVKLLLVEIDDKSESINEQPFITKKMIQYIVVTLVIFFKWIA
jgi:hypothetical protein